MDDQDEAPATGTGAVKQSGWVADDSTDVSERDRLKVEKKRLERERDKILAERPNLREDGVYLVRASLIRPERVNYVEDGLIPLRVVTLITGLDGVGKSTILYDKAARATRGQLSGRFRGQPVDVVIASAEDHAESVIVPRLIAAGADLDRVHIVKVRRDGLDGDIRLPDDLDDVAKKVKEVGARLLIVDPLISHLPLKVDSHKAQHIRSVTAPLSHLAEDARLAVCAVVHFNGSASTDVRSRISGSKALRDSARSVLVCGEDPDDETRFVMVQDKFSFGPKPDTGSAYRIEGLRVNHDGERFDTSRVVWLGEVPITSRQMLAGPDDDSPTEREMARDVILDALAKKAQRWETLISLIEDEGVSERTGRRARDSLKRDGKIGKEKQESGWFWKLSTPDGQVDDGQVENPSLTWGNDPEESQLGHSADGGQVEPPGLFDDDRYWSVLVEQSEQTTEADEAPPDEDCIDCWEEAS